ncbi:MAG: hypothetical protein JO095_08560 [Alphaproteobacteria bacterium]|nr:hypothetical protein [Alphaproteobacteria bacterium]MBV9814185.1 hypothetical protein [Alphaproteobacteria bacterium]
MVIDYDFKLGKSHFRGVGPRGLAALAMVLVPRVALIGTIALSARSGGFWLLQLAHQLV